MAGVSLDYYKRLERGGARGVSTGVLEALAGALQLDDAERAHLLDLARAADATLARQPKRPEPSVRPEVLGILESIQAPAFLMNNRSDYLAANTLGHALYAPLFDSPEQPPNFARFCFLDPDAKNFYVDWERNCQDVVAHLRSEAGHDPHDRGLSDLVGELATRSQHFATWWAAHDVRHYRTGIKRLRHPLVGELGVSYEVLELPADPGLKISIYSAEPSKRSREALDLLASWAATPSASSPLDRGTETDRP